MLLYLIPTGTVDIMTYGDERNPGTLFDELTSIRALLCENLDICL
jgi:hypothetical protein